MAYLEEYPLAVVQEEHIEDLLVAQEEQDLLVVQEEQDMAVVQEEQDTVVVQEEQDTVVVQEEQDMAVDQVEQVEHLEVVVVQILMVITLTNSLDQIVFLSTFLLFQPNLQHLYKKTMRLFMMIIVRLFRSKSSYL